MTTWDPATGRPHALSPNTAMVVAHNGLPVIVDEFPAALSLSQNAISSPSDLAGEPSFEKSSLRIVIKLEIFGVSTFHDPGALFKTQFSVQVGALRDRVLEKDSVYGLY